jgi:hypothetical protein
MNIFFLDDDPVLAARQHNDAHVGKMLLEAVQMMSDQARAQGLPVGYERLSKGHQKHPMTLWVGASREHYDWCWNLALELDAEHQRRFDTEHSSGKHLPSLAVAAHAMPDKPWRNPPRCMPDEFKVSYDDHAASGRSESCHVRSYRDYYRFKVIEAGLRVAAGNARHRRMTMWTKTPEPVWLRQAEFAW